MSTRKEDVLRLADRAVEIALKVGEGIVDVEAYVVAASRISMDVRNGEIENLAMSDSLGLGLRMTSRDRTVFVHSTDTSGLAILTLARQAVEMAASLPEPKEPTPFAAARLIDGLPHPDPDLQSEQIERKQARLVQVENAMSAVPGVSRAVAASYAENDGEIAMASTRGLRLYTPFANVHVSCECIAERDGQSATGGNYISVASRSRLPEPERIGRQAGERAVALLGARPVPTVKAPVIFSRLTGWAVLRRLIPALRGDFVAQQRSFLGDQLGQPIAAPQVTIRDNAHLLGGAASRPFDGEGVPTTNLTLVEKGELRSFLTDVGSAQKLGLPNTGNSGRDGYNSLPQIGTTNLYLEPGDVSPEEIIRQTRRGLLVTVLSGWWVGMSPTSDTFSSAVMGQWIENGEIAHAVRGITIGGNLREMLAGIDRIGNDLEFIAETCAPTFRVAEMAISGT